MKKPKIIALAAALSLAVTALPIFVYGDDLTYNSENDPLISLSYIEEVLIPAYDKKIQELKNENAILEDFVTLMQGTVTTANDKIAALETKIKDIESKLDENDSEENNLGQYEVVLMTKGSKLLAESPCEIILRTGSAIAVSITPNGLNDITNGSEIMNSDAVPVYHSLLVPRGGDGRGIEITSPDAYVMVRGDYKIVG